MAYENTNPEVFSQRYAESLARPVGGSVKGWRPRQGAVGQRPFRNIIRLMPAHPNMVSEVTLADGRVVRGPDPIIAMRLHFSLGPQQNTAAPCLEPYGEPCPACEWSQTLFNRARGQTDPNAAQQYRDIAFRTRAKFRFAANIIDLNAPERGVQPYYFGPEVEQLLRSCFYDDQNPPQFRDIAHPEHGRNVIMEVGTKPGPDEFPDYSVIRAADTPTPLQDMDWLAQIIDLSQEIYRPTAAEVQAALQGQAIQRNRRAAAASVGAAPLPAVALPAPPTVPAPPVADVRRRGRPPRRAVDPAPIPTPTPEAMAPAPVANMPAPPASSPTAATSVPSTAPRSGRQPVGNGSEDPLAIAKAKIESAGITPKWMDLEGLRALAEAKPTPKLPPCIAQQNDLGVSACQGCGALVPCFAIQHGLLPRPAWLP